MDAINLTYDPNDPNDVSLIDDLLEEVPGLTRDLAIAVLTSDWLKGGVGTAYGAGLSQGIELGGQVGAFVGGMVGGALGESNGFEAGRLEGLLDGVDPNA